MTENERAVLEAIKSAKAQELTDYELKAWVQWGTPRLRCIAAVPVRLAPTLDPAVIAERAISEGRAEIGRLGYSAEEAAGARFTFEPDARE